MEEGRATLVGMLQSAEVRAIRAALRKYEGEKIALSEELSNLRVRLDALESGAHRHCAAALSHPRAIFGLE